MRLLEAGTTDVDAVRAAIAAHRSASVGPVDRHVH
jgi:hypothetical protein